MLTLECSIQIASRANILLSRSCSFHNATLHVITLSCHCCSCVHGLKVARRGFTESAPPRQVPLRSSSPLRGIKFLALVRERVPVKEAPPAPHYERAASWKVRRGGERKGKARSEGRWGPGRGKWRGGPFENARARLGPVNIMERRGRAADEMQRWSEDWGEKGEGYCLSKVLSTGFAYPTLSWKHFGMNLNFMYANIPAVQGELNSLYCEKCGDTYDTVGLNKCIEFSNFVQARRI